MLAIYESEKLGDMLHLKSTYKHGGPSRSSYISSLAHMISTVTPGPTEHTPAIHTAMGEGGRGVAATMYTSTYSSYGTIGKEGRGWRGKHSLTTSD